MHLSVTIRNAIIDKRILKFSYSKLNVFLTCPLQFKFKYIDRTKIEKSTDDYSTYLGRSVHLALENLYKNKDKDLEWLEILWIKICNDQFKESTIKSPDVFKDKNTVNMFRNHGRKILRVFYESNQENFKRSDHETIALEQKFTTPLKDFTLTGLIDKVERIGSEIFVVDYKTGAPPTQKEVDENLQLSFYAVACRKTGLALSNIHFVMHHVKHDVIIYTKRTVDDVKRLYSILQSVYDKIINEEYEATPSKNACRFCGFKQYCDAYKREEENGLE